MGKPEDPEFERRARFIAHERYKSAKRENQRLVIELSRAEAYIKVLENQLETCAEIVSLAEKVITEGTERDRDVAVARVDEEAAG